MNKEAVTFKVEKNHEQNQFAIVLEKGLKKEPIITSTPRREYRLKGFYKPSAGAYGNDITFDMQRIFTSISHTLKTLYDVGLLLEEQYDKLLEGYEPFIDEALEFSEFEDALEPVSIAKDKKKKIFNRRRGRI